MTRKRFQKLLRARVTELHIREPLTNPNPLYKLCRPDHGSCLRDEPGANYQNAYECLMRALDLVSEYNAEH